MKILRVAIAQINATVGDLEGNKVKIIKYLKEAKKYEADIVIFPELALCGYPPEDLLLKKHFVKDNLGTLNSVIEKASNITTIIGFVDMDPVRNYAKTKRKAYISNGAGNNKNLYNAAAIIHNNKLRGVYHKIELPNYGVFDEKRYFTPGRKNYVFKLRNLTFGVNICEDIWDTCGPYEAQTYAGARLLINISASPYHTGKQKLREEMLMDRARKTKSFICYTNLVGGQDELVFDGASFIFNPKGEIIASGKRFEEDLIVADLDIDSVSKHKSKRFHDKNVGVIQLSPAKELTKKISISTHKSKRLGYLEEVYNALILGTRDYVKKNGFEKVVLGLSGGIDSALTALIACDAIGKENVIGISMPSQYSSKATQSDAKLLANNLGIRLNFVPIESIFSVYQKAFEKEFADLTPDVTEENLQARIRGNILMAFSNKFGWLVLTTGNKSETSVGYCTLYGDMAGGFAVIKDVPKTLVYKLARFRNEKEGKALIPESIFTREPSAELRQGQKDSDILPPYSVLDQVLKAYIEEDKSFDQTIAKKFSPEIVKNVIKMVDRNEYKRRQAPPGIKITPKAFGRDRRFPITNKYRGF